MKEKRKQIILIILSLMALILLLVIGYYWYNNTFFVSTEDAHISGDMVVVSSQATGKLADLFVDEGSYILKDQIIGKIDIINQIDSNIELSLIRSPINGTVIKKQGTVGEIIAAGQTILYLADPKEFYISANIEETKIKKVQIGQKVNIKLDLFGGEQFSGKVYTIAKASNSTFSLFPSNSGSTFTKVVQKIPVKIKLDNIDSRFVVGTNAFVKISIK
ncbi:MAG: hemolysin D [Spirochaetes bacterium GWC1_27_15]|nr:MAG: hemolysin D [Spirochaetes bacterium GWB1_27_13]OHD24530.1 MAG: hemolysin D [Spirochaetes bacterium GWC1_27_15]